MSLPLFRWVIEATGVDVRACSPSVNCAFVPPSQTYFLAEFSQRHFCGGYLRHGTPGTGLCLWTSDIWKQESPCDAQPVAQEFSSVLVQKIGNFFFFFFLIVSFLKCQGTSLLFLMLCTLQCIKKNSLRCEFLGTWCIIHNKFVWRCIKPLLWEPLFHVAFVSVHSLSGS